MTGCTTRSRPRRSRTRTIFAILACLAASAGFAAQPSQVLSAQAAFELPQPAPDEIIAYGAEPRQFGEVRLPEGDGPFGVAVVIHGGCWLSACDQGYMAAFAEAITDLGWATWTIAYRRVGEPGGGWPNTFLDGGPPSLFCRNSQHIIRWIRNGLSQSAIMSPLFSSRNLPMQTARPDPKVLSRFLK